MYQYSKLYTKGSHKYLPQRNEGIAVLTDSENGVKCCSELIILSIRCHRMESIPLYREVQAQLRYRIETGAYEQVAYLPSETRLSQEFSVSLITIRRALHELALDGLIERRQGVGNLVRAKGRSIVVGLSSFTSDIAAGRLRIVRSLVTDRVTEACAEEADKLQVQLGAMLRHLRRLDTEGRIPLAVDDVYMPLPLAAAIAPSMAASPLFIHQWQKASGIRLVRADYDFRVELPTAPLQELLQIGADTPLLVTGELIRDETGRPCVWIVSRYRGDRCRLSGSVLLVQKEMDGRIIGE